MFVYKFKEGPYKKCAELFKEANSIGPELSCIGIFYDDPTKVSKTRTSYNQYEACWDLALHLEVLDFGG